MDRTKRVILKSNRMKNICKDRYDMIYLMCSFERAIFQRVYLLIAKAIGLVAQLVRAPPCHGGGRGFEPHPGRCYHFPDDNLLETAYNYIWGLSSAGRASALQAEGHRFEPCRPHQFCRLGSMAEQLICNQQVVGSTPTVGSILIM